MAFDMVLEAGLVALIGLCFGSFATMVAHRLPRGESLASVHSRCPHCRKNLSAKELIPLVSWAWNRGRCAGCEAPVGLRYPAMELLQAALFLFVYHRFGLTAEGGLLMAASVVILIMAAVDSVHYELPDSMQVALLALGIWFAQITGRPWENVAAMALGCLGLGLVLHVGYRLVTGKDGLGLGDVKLLAVAGVWLPFTAIPAFLFTGGALGIATAALWRARGHGPVFPFGPALLAALFMLVTMPEIGDDFQRFFASLYAHYLF